MTCAVLEVYFGFFFLAGNVCNEWGQRCGVERVWGDGFYSLWVYLEAME